MPVETTSVEERSGDKSSRNGKAVSGFFAKWRPRVGEQLRFLGGFLRGPATVGAIGPSSPALAEAMIDGFGLGDSDTVVELGPGTGAFTTRILAGIGRATTFIALERDPIFAKGLTGRCHGVTVYNDSAENLRDYLARHNKHTADYIVSGLPWASLPLSVQENVLEAVLQSLAPAGMFSTFGYVHALWMPNAKRFRQRLQRRFRTVDLSPVVWRNFPPAVVYRCRK